MLIKICWILVFWCCLSCNNEKEEKVAHSDKNESAQIHFDKAKWRIVHDNVYPYRDKMLQHLIASDTLRGLKKEQVLSLLGIPTRQDTGYLFYRIAQKRIGFFPLHTKTLVLHLPGDSIVKWIKIHK